MTSDGTRTQCELDGEWEFITDPSSAGREDSWFDPNASWPDRAHDVSVPHVWQEHDDLHEYTGTAWYRRTFEVAGADLDERDALLRFGAVDYAATVWVNGERVGEHAGGYLPFELDVTDALEAGENHVAIAVTDPDDLAEIPHGKQGDPWYTRVSGIWQSVTLAFRPRTRVTDAKVTPDLHTDTAGVVVDTIVGDDVSPSTIECVVEARLDGDVVTETRTTLDDPGSADVTLDFDDPAYWSPDDPTLYDLVVRLERAGGSEVVDRYTDTFGLRSFEVADGEFRLNGEPFTMRGVLEQGYYPGTLYRPPSQDTFEHEVAVAKELGFNLIRKHIKPAHPDFLAEADRQGILVWEEPANPTRFTKRSRTEVEDQLHELVERDYNRPSVVIWSIYNEEWGIGHHDAEETLWTDDEKQRFLANCYETVRELDPTRVVCDNSGWAHVTTDVNDFHRYFVSPDRAAEWEADLDHISHHPRDNYVTREFDDGRNVPVIISELGTWGLAGVESFREHAGGDPAWFDHSFLEDPVKRPAGFDEQFESTTLSDVFDGIDAMEEAWQWREFVSVKHLLEQIRTRPKLDGYVLTELSDIEWEFNGVLDYLREEKAFHERFAAVNAPASVVVEPDSHVGWQDDTFDVTVTVVNDTGDSLDGAVEWELGDDAGRAEVSVPSHDVAAVPFDSVAYPAGSNSITTSPFDVTFDADEHRATSSEPITVVDPETGTLPDATVYAEGTLASRLARAGIDVRHELTDEVDVAFTDRITSAIDRFADQGGAVVHIPTTDGEMANGGPFTYHEIPREESWLGATSLFYQDTPLLDDICDSPRLGWEFEGVYPYAAATDLDDADQVHIGYVEGWLANWSSPLVVRDYGVGSMTALTFRVRGAYGDHPVVTRLIDRLVDRLVD